MNPTPGAYTHLDHGEVDAVQRWRRWMTTTGPRFCSFDERPTHDGGARVGGQVSVRAG
eukprot:CAMPEP_0182578028 /NCGR_PEP_ID=MMETSP1324-20130603/39702_1 /TAXON_ID=236786 /ORGANISM="Florenciella sp., Strain RCC1587" /LENGTH=57 /DNA_ID=CAMNT_0024793931 /DNA_START=25 /DNA_END=194 /DNA_ORIENTATION=+